MPSDRRLTVDTVAHHAPARTRPTAHTTTPIPAQIRPSDAVAGEPGHGTRVASLAARIARRTGAVDPEHAYRAGLLHDVGKVLLPFDPTQIFRDLTPGERTVVEWHPSLGAALLAAAGEHREVVDGVLFHHERLDGTGYPYGLRGDDVPLIAQVIGAVDVYDALTSVRSYKPAWSRTAVIQYGIEHRGREFLPEIWDAVVAETCRSTHPVIRVRL